MENKVEVILKNQPSQEVIDHFNEYVRQIAYRAAQRKQDEGSSDSGVNADLDVHRIVPLK
ncbi:hypothetical protein ACOALA_10155 [Alicyclobacillus acidoterrestris]|uniref:hypothetical protein n=1 Tax=Alicyclobacillus acidoterrestris TaxID=1450 RepID=UPI003F539357